VSHKPSFLRQARDTLIAHLPSTGGLGADEWAGGRVEGSYPEVLLLALLSGPLGAPATK
jgi:hypothetical protein